MVDTVGTPAFSVALEWQSPNWGSTESSRVRVAPGPSHVLPTKTRSTSQPLTPHPQRPALSVPEVGIHGQWQGLGRFVRAQKEKILEDWRQQKLGNQGMHR